MQHTSLRPAPDPAASHYPPLQATRSSETPCQTSTKTVWSHGASPPRTAERRPVGARVGALWALQSHRPGPSIPLRRIEPPGIEGHCETLMKVSYLNEIVISLDRASALEFRLAKQFFSVLSQPVRLIWNDGARIQTILQLLVDHKLDIGLQGKGRGCWTAFGYVLARNHSQVIALHDCDITSYSREYLARLCYPIANPNLGYKFCKGYYTRVTDRLHGQLTRQFITPMIRSLQQLVGPHALLRGGQDRSLLPHRS